MSELKIICTGGTFEKVYDPSNGELDFTESPINELLKQARYNQTYSLKILMSIDSLEMTNEHREKILEECKQSKEDKILIIHGTDTMPESAEYLLPLASSKTIVFTGAMVPASIQHSDALFNLGFALGVLENPKKGVFIAINGQTFKAGKVKKDRERALFIEVK